ncbi:MAG: hypothetical protein M3O71_22170 [Bacteroidota bacterium]|nr:hypothetical protein [Bacteroidota bacterium]
MKILITAATSAEAHKLKNQLSADDIILGDYLELPAFMLKNADMVKLPNPASPSYTHEMLTLSLDKEVNKIYALRDEERTLLEESKQLFNEYGIEVVHGS